MAEFGKTPVLKTGEKMVAVKRNQPLDVLRGVAILLVLGRHYSYFHWWRQIGWTGVDLFFVLSGFLISGLLFAEIERTGKINLLKFWIRRGFKIYPPFYALMALTVSWMLFARQSLNPFWGQFVWLQNYTRNLWPHTWSLAVEEHFYFLLPFVLLGLCALACASRRFQAVAVAFVIVAVGCLAARILAVHFGVPDLAIAYQTQYRIDSLFAGVFIQAWRRSRTASFEAVVRKAIWIPGVLLVASATFLPPSGAFMLTAGFSLVWIGYGLVLMSAVGRSESRDCVRRAVAGIGRHSYSIYLWHYPIMVLMFMNHQSFTFFLVGICVSIVFGISMSVLIESSSIRLRDKLFPSKDSALDRKRFPVERATSGIGIVGVAAAIHE